MPRLGFPLRESLWIASTRQFGKKPAPCRGAALVRFKLSVKGARGNGRIDPPSHVPNPRAQPTFRDDPPGKSRVLAPPECATSHLRPGAGDINWGSPAEARRGRVFISPILSLCLPRRARTAASLMLSIRELQTRDPPLPNTHVRSLRPEDPPTRLPPHNMTSAHLQTPTIPRTTHPWEALPKTSLLIPSRPSPVPNSARPPPSPLSQQGALGSASGE